MMIHILFFIRKQIKLCLFIEREQVCNVYTYNHIIFFVKVKKNII